MVVKKLSRKTRIQNDKDRTRHLTDRKRLQRVPTATSICLQEPTIGSIWSQEPEIISQIKRPISTSTSITLRARKVTSAGPSTILIFLQESAED